MIENDRKLESQIENNIKSENQDQRRVELYRGGHWQLQQGFGFRVQSQSQVMTVSLKASCCFQFLIKESFIIPFASFTEILVM